ncbi:ABC transporter ATP-binding protein (plasmid) [Paraburkholderia terrae]|uniref:ABC transporter ATP-binding protein n=1 Tax=Paraburkholderia terrae TaxID=311230 RepID=A0ABM7U357_9BURK|nr:sugar ABC transporter ATP-binding protein [Paraburkholderia terrae]BCZ85590.1 ABC transporter ATP-binding protein [Paraburkholderia terrae]
MATAIKVAELGEGASTQAFLELQGVTKRYGGVTALDGVCLRVERGSIHAVLGENGAGKSTLMKILSGVVTPEEGSIELAGERVALSGPRDALARGIVCVFQELSIVPHLSVAENICLARPPRNGIGLISQRSQHRVAREALRRLGCADHIRTNARCADLPLSKRQLVEIAKAIVQRPRVLILDEATSALTVDDVRKVMCVLKVLRDEGTSILFISHRMHEVDELADTCSVFRSGRHVATFTAGAHGHDEIVRMMIGRPVTQVYPPKPVSHALAAPVLCATGIEWAGQLRGVDVELRPGEIVGLGGLDGQGQRELLLALGGVLSGVRGQIRIGCAERLPRSPREGKRSAYRLAFLSEDRKNEGLILDQSIRQNLSLAALETLGRHGVVAHAEEDQLVKRLVSSLQIKAPDVRARVSTLSGGNQQKVLLGKWLATEPRILLLADPTRGVDVGTKEEIYRLFRKLAAEGMAILLYSSDYDELIGLCDRVLVMYGGKVQSCLSGPSLNEHQIIADSLNLKAAAAPVAWLDMAKETR